MDSTFPGSCSLAEAGAEDDRHRQADGADDDAPPGEHGEAVARDEAQKAAHDDQRREEGDDEAERDDQPGAHVDRD